ncbi:MAG TPA: sigma-70 family RNA polymerase sigma factor [Acidimicrobiia bacterium]|nr:sigma-70 family RNA polymerase sigma factor [Acidimicrobiia bacterium]
MSTEDGRVEVPGPARDAPFAELFATHYAPALRLAALLEGDPTRAEDAVCDAFARVYGRLRRGGVEDVSPYLRQAVVNAVRGGWRRRQVERRYAREFEADALVPAFELEVVERDEVWRALRRLPAGQRRVVVLRYYEDLSEAEVARLLRIKAGTVKSQAAKGLAALQSILEVRDG